MSPNKKGVIKKAAAAVAVMTTVLSSYFLAYQSEYLADESRLKILEKSRRIGGTYMQSYEDVRDIVERKEYTPGRPVERVYFVSKDELAGKEYIDYCKKWARIFNLVAEEFNTVVIEEDGEKVLVLEFANGGKIFALSSSPTAFNSKGGKIVWDEAALHKNQREMWAGAKPAAMWGYPIRILSTHKGKKTLFYTLCQNAVKGKSNFSHHKIPIQRAVADGLADKISGRVLTDEEREAWLEKERIDCQDNDTWMQDYCCEPVDGATAFITYEQIESITSSDDIKIPFVVLKKNIDSKRRFFAGWDVARNRDLSVVTIGEELPSGLIVGRHIEVFENVKTPVQKRFAREVMKIPGMRKMTIDKTGMGLPIYEDLEEEFGAYRVEGIHFTTGAKSELATRVKNVIEDHNIRMFPDDLLRESIHSLKKIVTPTGVRFDADHSEESGHADHFWSLALMLHSSWETSKVGQIYTRGTARTKAPEIIDKW